MLASESAWRVLQTEHAEMRELLRGIESAMATRDWRTPGPALDSLIGLVLRLRSFDDATHRPKGIALFAALRGRQSETDALIRGLEAGGEERDRLLADASATLSTIRGGDAHAGEVAERLLEQHGTLLRRDLDLEDTVLQAQAGRLLNPEQWSAIVSSISAVVSQTSPGRRRPER